MNARPKLPMLKAFTGFMRRKPKSLEAAYARAFEAGWNAAITCRSEQGPETPVSPAQQGSDCGSGRS